MVICLVLVGIFLSVSMLLIDSCGSSCGKTSLDMLLPYIGVVYFLITGTLHLKGFKQLKWVVLTATVMHLGLLIYGLASGKYCFVCIAVLAVNVGLLALLVQKKTKILAFASAIVFTAAAIGYQLQYHETEGYAMEVPKTALANEEGLAPIEYEHLDSSTISSVVALPGRDMPSYKITVSDTTGPVEIDIVKNPVLLWAPFCTACKDVIPLAENVHLVAMWIHGEEEQVQATEYIEQVGNSTFFTDTLDTIDIKGVPALVYWDDGIKVAEGKKAVLELLSSSSL